jgi:Holliday junction resolvase RusA-like endonuclease
MARTKDYVKKHLEQHPLPKLLSGPLLVIAHYKIPAPKALPERKRLPQHTLPHAKKPDGDNLEKFLNDALNGVVWSDDSKIAWLLRSKSLTKAREGETVLFVRELDSEAPDYDAILTDICNNLHLE